MYILQSSLTSFHERILGRNLSLPELAGSARMIEGNLVESLWLEAQGILLQTHSSRLVRKSRIACMKKGRLAETRLSPKSWDAIKASVVLALLAAQENAFAVTCPPGHHASYDGLGGFCFLNNIAIAVNSLLENGKRVSIIDFDGHFGNGTERLMRQKKGVTFHSIFQLGSYPKLYRKTRLLSEKGFSIGLPAGSRDDVFLGVLKLAISDIMRFDPDHIAVSAGFDGYVNDHMLELEYSVGAFFEAGRLIHATGKKVFAVLEGGYTADTSRCIEAFIDGFNKHAKKVELTRSPTEILNYVAAVLRFTKEKRNI